MKEERTLRFMKEMDIIDFTKWMSDNCEIYEGEIEYEHHIRTPEEIAIIYMNELKNS